jgi:Arc/MetJ-type ribon-helix-helix transcriptional regulator
MSTQITVRIPDELAAFLDGLVSSGDASSRADAVTRALVHEQRRRRAEADLEVIRAHDGDPYPDLAGIVGSVPQPDLDLELDRELG